MGTTADIENYPGVDAVSGPALVEQFEAHVDRYRVHKFIGEQVNGVEIKNRCRIVRTASDKAIHGRTIILASGAGKRKLDIPGELELAGKGVVYCATCDGPLFRDQRVAIIGGGNSALEAAIEMSTIASQVTLVSRGTWTGDAILQDRVNASDIEIMQGYEPAAILGNGKVSGLEVRDRASSEVKTLTLDGVFIEIGLAANSEYILDLLDTNARGEIHVDRKLETGVRGIFSAGDVNAGTEKQVVIAAAEGARAALSAFSYLLHQS
jgi:alkyl hydroperoxide reductase subunit F